MDHQILLLSKSSVWMVIKLMCPPAVTFGGLAVVGSLHFGRKVLVFKQVQGLGPFSHL